MNSFLGADDLIKYRLYEGYDQHVGHVEIDNLPAGLRSYLPRVHKGKDIRVVSNTHVTPTSSYGDGHRAHFAMVHASTGKAEHEHVSSWGGSNMFTTTPHDRLIQQGPMGIQKGFVAVHGGRQGIATLVVHPDDAHMYAPKLPENLPQLSNQHLAALAAHNSLKSAGRKRHLSLHGANDSHVNDLVSFGLLKQNRAGATSITTTGRNVHNTERDKASAHDTSRWWV